MELVNPVPVDEVEPWTAAATTTLLGTPWGDNFARSVDVNRREWDANRTWGVYDNGRWVATLLTDTRALTVPGPDGRTADLSADALGAVSVAATHRRQGLLRQMITLSLQQAVDRGDAAAVLLAAEWPIYGRYGYAPATRCADYVFQSRWAGAVIGPDPAGTVRQADPAELGHDAVAIFDAARRRWPGQVDRLGDWWAQRLGLDGYEPAPGRQGTWVLHETDGRPDGLLCWRVAEHWRPTGDYATLQVLDFEAASDTAYRNLWAYLASLDVVGEIRLGDRPVDEPVRWLLGDGRALKQQYAGDHLWLRLLDVPTALSTRAYATSARIVLEVIDDDLGGYAAGRYALDAGPDGGSCARTTESADLQLSQRALASTYLGDQSLRALAIAGGVDELTPGAVARADALFATPVRPWNATAF